MKSEMEKWEEEVGIKLLKKVGIKSGQAVLDFGCKTGHYTIPTARIVGNEGIVYAIDKRQDVLNELEEKSETQNIKNIKIIKTNEKPKFNFKKESIDVILAYDVLHYFKKDERKRLYKEFCRISKPNAIFSTYPKHTSEDYPLLELARLSLDEIKQEIEREGFSFIKRYYGRLSHDDDLINGYILNFKKK